MLKRRLISWWDYLNWFLRILRHWSILYCLKLNLLISNLNSSLLFQKKKVMKARKRIACILLLLSVLFFLCWLPYHIRMLIDDIASAYLQINDTRDALSVPELLNHTYGEVLTSAWSNHTSTDELYTNFDINRWDNEGGITPIRGGWDNYFFLNNTGHLKYQGKYFNTRKYGCFYV